MQNEMESSPTGEAGVSGGNGQKNKSGSSKLWLWVLIGIIILAIVAGACLKFLRPEEKTESNKASGLGPVSIPQKVLNNKFGWLGGGAEDRGDLVVESGGAWVRPHPGAFVWDMMQKSKNGEIDFSLSDEIVGNLTSNNLGVLATIWPFADWDQKNLANANDCKVEANDEFLPKNDKKGRGSYLPQYRCKPADWTAYESWVAKVVERYDGDGVDDMPGLKLPIKYWEVMNEPDLTSPPEDNGRLDFWKGNAVDYAELLVKTSSAIKSADIGANVLIAGAAGGDKQFLDFYRTVFVNEDARTAFDIGNVHCISNDQQSHDFNVVAYKNMLAEFGISQPVWVTEAEAFYPSNTTAEQNYQNTKTSTASAIAAGAERIFFTRYNFDDFRTDMSQKTGASSYDSTAKYRELAESLSS